MLKKLRISSNDRGKSRKFWQRVAEKILYFGKRSKKKKSQFLYLQQTVSGGKKCEFVKERSWKKNIVCRLNVSRNIKKVYLEKSLSGTASDDFFP